MNISVFLDALDNGNYNEAFAKLYGFEYINL